MSFEKLFESTRLVEMGKKMTPEEKAALDAIPTPPLDDKLHVTPKAAKVNVAGFGFPPVASCGHDCPCRGGFCYACNSMNRLPDAARLNCSNYDTWLKDPKKFEDELRSFLSLKKPTHFRYLTSGDVPNAAFVDMAARLADEFPRTKFWLPSKMGDTIDLEKYDKPNLAIMNSLWADPERGEWGTLRPNMRQSFVQDEYGSETRIPEDAFICPCNDEEFGGCGSDRPDTGEPCTYCWDMKPGQSVVFMRHGNKLDMAKVHASTDPNEFKSIKALIARYGLIWNEDKKQYMVPEKRDIRDPKAVIRPSAGILRKLTSKQG